MTVVPEILTGGPTLPQERRLLTALPGPRTAELQARKSAAVATGVGVTMLAPDPRQVEHPRRRGGALKIGQAADGAIGHGRP